MKNDIYLPQRQEQRSDFMSERCSCVTVLILNSELLSFFLDFFNQLKYAFRAISGRGAKEAVTQWVILRSRKRPERVNRSK